MTTITLTGNPIETCGELPTGSAPNFELVNQDLETKTLADYAGKTLILNIFPSIDTGVCAQSTQTFNQRAGELENCEILCISKDLPFALSRFCGAEDINNLSTLSAFRSQFGQDYGLEITTGVLSGLLSRAVIVINGAGEITYSEQVPEIAQEPNYDAAIAAAKA